MIAIGIATVVGGALLAGAGYAAHRHGGGHGLGMHGFGKGHLALFAMDIFDSIDADGDGRLSQAEIDQVRNDRHAAHDANGDGSLVLEEFAGLWQETTHPLAVRVFQMLDADGDAVVTRVEYDRPLAGIVERLDRDRDGDGALSMRDRWRRHHGERSRDDG